MSTVVLKAQPVPFDWRSATVPNNTYGDDVRDIAVDTVNSYIYAVGMVHGGGPYGLSAYNGTGANMTPRRDGFLVKLNLDGSLVWAKTLGGTGSDELNAVAIGTDGNIYVTGSFQNSISLGTAANTVVSISSAGGSDIMVASYYPADGSLNWIRSAAGANGDDRGTGIVALPSGVFITGDYRRRIYFTGSTSVAETNNSQNLFFAKYNLNGTFLASCSGGTEENDRAGKLATDGTSIYTCGTIRDDEDARWRNSNGSTAAFWENLDSDNSMFVLSVDQSCNLNWARYIINPGSSNITVGAIAVDAGSCGNLYLAGATHKNTKFPSFGTTSPAGNPHDFLFLAALAKTNGNTQWLRTAQGPVYHVTAGLDIDLGPKGEVYLCGTYASQITWDDGTTASGSSGKEMFAARFTSYGKTEWFMPVTGANDDVPEAIAAGKNGAVFLGGTSNTTDLFLGRVSEIGPLLWPTNPSNFNLPATRCQTAGSLSLNSLVPPLHEGNAVTVISSNGVSNLTGVLGVPDGIGIQFSSNGSSIGVDLGETLDAGSTVQLVWRRATTGTSGLAIPMVEVSLDGTTWTLVPAPPSTTSTDFIGGNFALPTAARYVRVQKDNALSTIPFEIDAFRFTSGALTGGAWSGPGVSGSTFDLAGLTGPQSITYTVSCYSTTKVIQIDPSSVGGTLSGGGSACLGTAMELTLAGNTGGAIIWQVSTNGGTTWVNDTTGQHTHTVTTTLPATRVRVRSISGSCAAATSNTVQVVGADSEAPVLSACPGNITAYTPANGCAISVDYTLPTATDNCSGVLTIVPQNPAHASGSQFSRGSTTVTIRASDPFGNVSTCAFSINVVDTVKPTIACPDPVAVYTTAGCGAINLVLGTPVTSDNCGPVTVTNNAPAIFPAGITNVIWTATDASGNTRTCTQQVTVTDNVPPSITCPTDRSVTANAGCAANSVSLGSPVTGDNCAIASVTNNSTSSYPLGVTTVTWTVMDNAGNTNSCVQRITVTDITPPTLSCPAAVQVVTNDGCTATGVDLGNPVAADNCDVVSLTNDAPSIFPIGTTTVTWTAVDAGGNTATCTQTVTVTDATPPTITCPANVQATTNTGCTATGVDLGTPTTDDNCAGVTLSNNAPSSFPIGSTTVRWTATDNSGNTTTCTQTVTVTDNTPPTITCPADVQTTTNTGCTATGVDLGTADADDNCNVVTLINDAPAAFPIGATTVTWTATDANGNSATCTQIVTVTDAIAPAISGPVDLQVDANAGCTATGVDLGTPNYSDNCTGATLSNDAPSVFPLGTTTVTWTATDASGNSATSTQSVTVKDHTNPIALCREITLNVDSDGSVHITAAMVDDGSSDNCSIASMSVMPQDFNSLGDHEVTLTVTDAAGNSATCSTIVHVVDNSPPVAVCNDITVYLDAAGEASIPAEELDGGSFDNDSIVGFSASRTLFTCADLGMVADTLFVTDNSGNTSFCIVQVTVLDTVAPVVVCQAIDVYLDASGNATFAASELDYGSSDACGQLNFSASHTQFSCTDIGVVEVTLTATDASGNSATCTAQVTILDTIAPVAQCQTTTAYLNANGFAQFAPADLDAESTDNCGISSSMVVPSEVQGAGDHSVQLIVTDASGNIDSCTTVATVLDTLSPVALCQDTLLQLGTSGTVNLNAIDLDGGSTDNDGITHWAASQLVFGCADVGLNTDTLFVTDGSGNTSFCVCTVTIVDPFTANAGTDNIAEFCAGGTSASLFSYLGSDAQAGGSWWLQGQAITDDFDPALDAPGDYLYTVANTSGCQVDSAVVHAVVHPNVNAGQDTSITVCSSDTAFALINFLPGADAGGTWSNGAGWFDPSVNASNSILYTVSGVADCPADTATVSVHVNTAPNAGNDGSLALCTDAPTSNLFSALQGLPDASGQWTDPLGQIVSGSFDPTTIDAGTYTYTVTGLAPCGQTSSTVAVSLIPQPSAAWSTPDPICDSSDPVDLDAFVTGVSGGTWSGTGVSAGTSLFNPGIVALQGASTSIELTYTATENGCQASAAGTIIVLASPVADAGEDASACGLNTILNASASYGTGHWSASGDVEFSSVDAFNSDVQVTAPGTYDLQWTVTNGHCTSTSDVQITFHIPGELGEVNAGSDESWNIKRSFQLLGVAEGATEIRWSILEGSGYIHEPEELSTEVSDLAVGTNTFMLSARVGVCPFKMDTVVLVVRDLFIPSGYSPNGDGVNDNFEIVGIDVYPDNELTIFNRWGQVVYQATGYANEWNGLGNAGSPLMNDTYFYVLKFNAEGATYNGQVIIKR